MTACLFESTTVRVEEEVAISFLKTATLTEFKPNAQPSPVANRRAKLAQRVEEQIRLASDSTYRPTKIVWTRNSEGGEHKVEQPKRIKRWWVEQEDGAVQLTVRYGAKPFELAKGKQAIRLANKDAVEPTLRALKAAVLAGEFDTILAEQVGYGRRKEKPA